MVDHTPMKVEFLDKMGNDCTVVNAARVSFDKHHKEFIQGRDEKLLDYLADHDHWSPFAHCFMQFRVKAPIFVARQLVKHQIGLAWNEVSRRYVDTPPEFYFPEEWRGRPENAKQGSSDVVIDFDPVAVEGSVDYARMIYTQMIEKGVAPEQARMLLPQNMMTEWYWSGSLMAFARICYQRLKPNAQKETAWIARNFDSVGAGIFPNAWGALQRARE